MKQYFIIIFLVSPTDIRLLGAIFNFAAHSGTLYRTVFTRHIVFNPRAKKIHVDN